MEKVGHFSIFNFPFCTADALLAQVHTLAATTSTDGLEEIVQHLQSLNQHIPYVTEEDGFGSPHELWARA